jgi:hypothetical protein
MQGDKMAKKSKKFELDTDKFTAKVKEYFNAIKPGLEEGKSLITDGLINLSKEQVHYVEEGSTESICLLIMLVVMIQSYPGNGWSCEKDQEHLYANALSTMMTLTTLIKHGYVEALDYKSNKIDLNLKYRIKLSDKCISPHIQ